MHSDHYFEAGHPFNLVHEQLSETAFCSIIILITPNLRYLDLCGESWKLVETVLNNLEGFATLNAYAPTSRSMKW